MFSDVGGSWGGSEIAKLDAIGLNNEIKANFFPSIANNIAREEDEKQIVDSEWNE